MMAPIHWMGEVEFPKTAVDSTTEKSFRRVVVIAHGSGHYENEKLSHSSNNAKSNQIP